MGHNPSLSMRSIYTGGATIRGVEHGPRGDRTVSYSWYESDIRNERGSVTWTDADRAFDMFAREYAAGKRCGLSCEIGSHFRARTGRKESCLSSLRPGGAGARASPSGAGRSRP
jgi:hypothetical protein